MIRYKTETTAYKHDLKINIQKHLSFVGCELSWPSEPNTGNYISKKNALVTKLTEFTVSFWIKVPNTDVLLYPFSYATSSVTSAFLVGIKSDGTAEITVRGSTE